MIPAFRRSQPDLQVTDDFTKILGKHSFKGGVDSECPLQHLAAGSLPRPIDWDGTFTEHPNLSTTTGVSRNFSSPHRQRRLRLAEIQPQWVQLFRRGRQRVDLQHRQTYDERKYNALYLQDDWKVNPS